MKKNIEYQRLVSSYREWLIVMNYIKSSQVVGPRKVQQFLEWLSEEKEIQKLEQVTDKVIKSYFEKLSKTISKRTGLVYSTATLRTYQTELKRFSRYLNETSQGHLEISLILKTEKKPNLKTRVFTRQQIEQLYGACADDVLGIRDKAILAVYYGCGLRRNEGVNLELKDIQCDRSLIHVRKGKNYKERMVPMVGRVSKALLEYLQYARPRLVTQKSGSALFINYQKGEKLGAHAFGARFMILKEKANITQEGSLHALRHSIATHLMESGMSLENIAKFLGHASLESTQIYTHVVHTKI